MVSSLLKIGSRLAHRPDAILHLGGHGTGQHQDRAQLLLGTVRVQRVELPQLCHRGASGSRQKFAPSYRHQLRSGHRRLRLDQRRLLHHALRAGGPRFRGCRSGKEIKLSFSY